ncbi:MAG: bifunctional DNA-formamidopyrimidine glycosylase/DNA-(apurinic or apyrimidinic site) lyase [Acidimicrobiales bacterium]
MPELPEVETIRRQIEPAISNRVVVEAGAFASDKFTPAREVEGATVVGANRRGKYLLFPLDDGRELIVHLGMTGQLIPDAPIDDPYLRAWWRLDSGSTIGYRDVRRFGRIRVTPAGEYEGTLAAIGPEPFSEDFTPTSLHASLKTSTRHLKTQLLSQRPVAGLGNIYADEACFRAGVHPAARQVSKPRAARLHAAIIEVLEQGIKNGGTTLRDYVNAEGETGSNQGHLDCYGRYGEPCVNCGTELRRSTIDARTTTHCPICQRR